MTDAEAELVPGEMRRTCRTCRGQGNRPRIHVAGLRVCPDCTGRGWVPAAGVLTLLRDLKGMRP
jgi:DnaJ-class molecular chaperone